jgi:hypothetical protein
LTGCENITDFSALGKQKKLNLSNIKIKPVKTDFCLVDEVLNYKVKVTAGHFGDTPGKIEDILNNID